MTRRSSPVRVPSEVRLVRGRGHVLAARAGDLPVSCWCERAFVSVPRIDVARGHTVSCGAAGCEAPPVPRQERPFGEVRSLLSRHGSAPRIPPPTADPTP